ncbi:MAG: hypothetical protein ACK4GD_03440 [Sphingomonadaceae bacterium]
MTGLRLLFSGALTGLVALAMASSPLAACSPQPQADQHMRYTISDAIEGGEYRSAVTQTLVYTKHSCPVTKQPELLARLAALDAQLETYRQRITRSVLAVDFAIAEADLAYDRSLQRVRCGKVDESLAAATVEVREQLFAQSLERLRDLTARFAAQSEEGKYGEPIGYGEAEAIEGAAYRAHANILVNVLAPVCTITSQPVLQARLDLLLKEANDHHDAMRGTRHAVDLMVVRGDQEHRFSLIDIDCPHPDQPGIEARITEMERVVRNQLAQMKNMAGLQGG